MLKKLGSGSGHEINGSLEMFKTKVYISFVILWKDLFKCFIMPEGGGNCGQS